MLDVYLVPLLDTSRNVYEVAHLALERDVRDEALHSFGIDAGQVAGVRVAVWVAVGDVE